MTDAERVELFDQIRKITNATTSAIFAFSNRDNTGPCDDAFAEHVTACKLAAVKEIEELWPSIG